MTSAAGNYLQNNDIELLRAFPATTSPANAAEAISRAIYTVCNAKLSNDVVGAVKAALDSLTAKPSRESLAGLMDAASFGVGAVDLDSFVLSTSVWRALLALLNEKSGVEIGGEDMLHIIHVAISSAVPCLDLIAHEPKYIRVSKFYFTMIFRFIKALERHESIPDTNTINAAFVLYQKIIQLDLLKHFHAAITRVLKVIFAQIPVNTWRSSFASSENEEEDKLAGLKLALYFVRCATGSDDDDSEWKNKCAQSLPTEMLPYLFDSFASLKSPSFAEKKLDDASILSVVTASVVNTCLYLDMHQGGVLEILLCKVSSPCIISSMVASFALVELYKYRNAAGRRRILDLTRQCLDLSKAVHSLHATQRWKPLIERLETGNPGPVISPAADLSSACTFSVLQRARFIHSRKDSPAAAEVTKAVRAGVQVSPSPVSEAIHAIVRAALDANANKDTKHHLTLISKHLPYS